MKWLPADDPSPALLVRPAGAASLDEAHLAIDQWEHYSRKRLDASQRVAVELMMAEGADGRWAARSTGRAMPRQNGKGDEVEVVEFFGLTQRGEAILHTAHEIPTAKSAHLRMVALLDHRDFRGRLDAKYGNGNFEIQLPVKRGGHVDRGDPGGIVVYRTRTAGGGRGLDDISRLVVDEAQHAQPEQLASSMPTLMVNPNPQRNFVGTSGILGKSDWWWTMRLRALRGDCDGFGYLEHSAERVELNRDGRVVSTPPVAEDEAAWALANPSFGDRLTRDELMEELKSLGPELFSREHLGVWDPFDDGVGGLVPFDAWLAAVDPETRAAAALSYGLSVSVDGAWAAVASAGLRADGRLHVTSVRHERSTEWVVAALVELQGRKRVPIRVNPAGAEGAFVRPLVDAGVEVIEVAGRDYMQGCGEVLDAVRNDRLRHLGQPELDRAVAAATRRDVGKEGGWVWAQSGSVDISPLKAVSLALTGVVKGGRAPRVHVYDPEWRREEVSV